MPLAVVDLFDNSKLFTATAGEHGPDVALVMG